MNVNAMNDILLFKLGLQIFTYGIIGAMLQRQNVLMQLILIELSIHGIILLMLYTSANQNDPDGMFFALFLLTISAADTAIILTILTIIAFMNGLLTIQSNKDIKTIK